MCGIVGYIGHRQAAPIVMEGLKRMEYRGYDSAGLCVLEQGNLLVYKRAGKVSQTESLLDYSTMHSTLAIGHTRWATHGEPNDINAHPHTDNSGKISLIHNGIIENYSSLKKKLISEGYTFSSDTDTEVLAVFIGHLYERTGDFELAVRSALSEVDGTFGLAVLCADQPDTLIAARRGSPIVIGIGDGEYIAASDAAAIIQHTRQVIYLNDDEMAVMHRSGYVTKTIDDREIDGEIHEIDFDIEQMEKGGFDHFMLKEIYEQPATFKDAIRGRLLVEDGNVKLGGLRPIEDKLRKARRIIILACGTSWHSGLVGEYMIEQLARIPVEVEYASEFRYRSPVIYSDDVIIAISQSGETADTLAAIELAKSKGATILGICNVAGSSIARASHAGSYTHAGPEIGVASTKAFTAQVTVLTLMALNIAQRKGTITSSRFNQLVTELVSVPEKVEKVLKNNAKILELAAKIKDASNALYLGRGNSFPVALEGALKLKEISYIHAEGYPAAEMKHGPIALIDEEMPVDKGLIFETIDFHS